MAEAVVSCSGRRAVAARRFVPMQTVGLYRFSSACSAP